MGGAGRARPPLDRVPGLGGSRGARPLDRTGRDGVRDARPQPVAARLAGDPRRADAVLLPAHTAARRLPAGRVRARHRLRPAAGAPGLRDVAGGGAGLPLGTHARPPVERPDRGRPDGRDAGARLLGAGDDRGALLSAAGHGRLGGRGGDRAPDAGQPDPAPGRVRRRLRDPHPGDRARAGARNRGAARRLSRPLVGAPQTPAARSGRLRRPVGRVGSLATGDRERGARRLRRRRQHLVQRRAPPPASSSTTAPRC